MSTESGSENPVVKAIINGTAPRPAILAAARGILPLPQNEMLEVLVALSKSSDSELAQNSRSTLAGQDADELAAAVKLENIPVSVLDHFVESESTDEKILESIIVNPRTSATSLAVFAQNTKHGRLLEVIALNQQLLIQNKAILDAIIANPSRTNEAERRATEVKVEFFEKERGTEQIAGELRAQGKEAAAEFIEQLDAPNGRSNDELDTDDMILLASLIEVPDSETDDSWLGLEFLEDIYEETPEQREAIINKIFGDLQADDDGVGADRMSMISKIMKLGMKDRVKLGMKGDREARNILVRDPNRIVAAAVINNPKITDQEVEKIASMRSIPEDLLRLIAMNRQWARNYTIMHNLAKNPRTPIANVMGILTRMQRRDLDAIAKNRNVSDAVRKQAGRIAALRKGN